MRSIYENKMKKKNKQEHSWNIAEEALTVIYGEHDQNSHFIYLHMCIDLNSGPQACLTSTLPNKLSSQPGELLLGLSLLVNWDDRPVPPDLLRDISKSQL